MEVPLRRIALCLTLGLAGLQSAVLPLAAQMAPQTDGYVAVGSLNMESTFLLWVDAYKAKRPSFRIELQPAVASIVVKSLLEGKAHLAPMNREMNAEEVAACTAKWGYAPTRIAVAMDALVVIVNKSNPLKEIKIEQLDAMYSSTRLQGWPKNIATWGDLGISGGNWAARPILRLGRPDGSGLRAFFRESVEMGGKAKEDNKRGVDAMSMVEEIISNQAAIGYGGLGEVFASTRAVSIIPKGGKTAVEPTPAAVVDGSYPLSMVLYIYVNKAPGKNLDPGLADFLRFILSKDGQKQVKANGLVPLPDDLIAMNLRRIGK